MTTLTAGRDRIARTFAGQRSYIPVLATMLLLIVMFGVASGMYPNFLDGQVVLNLFISNAFLIVIAVGMTFVLLTGGIDLSVGSVMALSTVLSAWLLAQYHWSPLLVIPFVLVVGTAFGIGMGAIIHYFDIQPFIVTLAGMFFARGLCHVILPESKGITDPVFSWFALTSIPIPGDLYITIGAVIALVVVGIAFYVLHYRRLGRNVYALGGGEQAAGLMGLPVARTKITVYAISGLCAALGGLLYAFNTPSGNPLHGVGLELDAIAAVVVGGTLLTGGSGYVLGTLLGVMVYGVINTIVIFESLNSSWTRIAVGFLLFLFIVLQRVIVRRKT